MDFQTSFALFWSFSIALNIQLIKLRKQNDAAKRNFSEFHSPKLPPYLPFTSFPSKMIGRKITLSTSVCISVTSFTKSPPFSHKKIANFLKIGTYLKFCHISRTPPPRVPVHCIYFEIRS